MAQSAFGRLSFEELVRRCLPRFEAAGLAAAGSLEAASGREVCELWGGMGRILELWARFSCGAERSFVVKVIEPPWDCRSVGDRRKRDSYEVECRFYGQGHAERLTRVGATCAVPLLTAREPREDGGERLMICMTRLEGRPVHGMNEKLTKAALGWLARMHAEYWGSRADEAVKDGLQPQGCYWYLDTRLEELAKTPSSGLEGRLLRCARGIDARLKADRHQTICHGDAKSENMLFRSDGSVSMFDFQYVGKASPCKDLAYCLICTKRDLNEADQAAYLEYYLSQLVPRLEAQGDQPPTFGELQAAYALSVCDLARWMAGWGWHGHRPMMLRRTAATLQAIDGGRPLGSEEEYMQAIFTAFPLA